MIRKAHQIRGVESVKAAILRGQTRICLTSPTGMGKSLMASDLAEWYLERGKRVSFYTNRKLLVEQMAKNMRKAGVAHGIRAAGNMAEHDEPLQISSIQTEHSRCVKRKTWELHQADLVIVDECHLFGGDSALAVIEQHLANGAVVVGLTATPIDLGNTYHELITAGSNSEGRECGLLVPAMHYGPDEPDLRHIGRVTLGEDLTEAQNVKAIMTHGVFGRVFESWKRLNPEQKPTILFAPGVKESVWFAQQFFEKGIPSAHIDGEEVWVNGTCKRSTPELRAEILNQSRSGAFMFCVTGSYCEKALTALGCDMESLRPFSVVFKVIYKAVDGSSEVTLDLSRSLSKTTAATGTGTVPSTPTEPGNSQTPPASSPADEPNDCEALHRMATEGCPHASPSDAPSAD